MSITEVRKHNVDINNNCSICLENFTEDGDSLVIAACEHVFHKNCFNTWRTTPRSDGAEMRQKDCPNCRGPLGTAQYIQPDTHEQVVHVSDIVLSYMEISENIKGDVHEQVANMLDTVPYVVVPGTVPALPVVQQQNPIVQPMQNADLFQEDFFILDEPVNAQQEAEHFQARIRMEAMNAHGQHIRERIIRENQRESGWNTVISIGLAVAAVILPIFVRATR